MRHHDGWAYFVVELRSAGLVASTGVSTYQENQLSPFLRRLADNWDGFAGDLVWASTEPGLRIVATHDGLHLRLSFRAAGAGWSASLDIEVEPGEELSQLAHDAETWPA